VELYGRRWTRRQLEARTGRTGGLFGLRRYKGTEGFEAGVEWIRMQSGAGLEVELCPSKALDIGRASFFGVPLHWSCVNGDVHPAYYEPSGAGWLRTASGGLLMTCGLANVGEAAAEQGEAHGMHGRIHHIPAGQVTAEGKWEQDRYEMRVAGVMEESAIYRSCLRLEREVAMVAGENRIALTDTVTNFGFRPAEHMMLYHFNFGFPLLEERTSFVFPHSSEVTRLGGGEAIGYKSWPAPDAAGAEAVYEHRRGRDGGSRDRLPDFSAGGDGGRTSEGRTAPSLDRGYAALLESMDCPYGR